MKLRILLSVVLLFLLFSPLLLSEQPEVYGRIVFASNRGGDSNLWIHDLESGITSKLTTYLGMKRRPHPRVQLNLF